MSKAQYSNVKSCMCTLIATQLSVMHGIVQLTEDELCLFTLGQVWTTNYLRTTLFFVSKVNFAAALRAAVPHIATLWNGEIQYKIAHFFNRTKTSTLLVYTLKNAICLSQLHYPLCSVVMLHRNNVERTFSCSSAWYTLIYLFKVHLNISNAIIYQILNEREKRIFENWKNNGFCGHKI